MRFISIGLALIRRSGMHIDGGAAQMKTLSVSPMLGRRRLSERLRGNLVKPTPDHLSLVGPRFFGKTVVLSALANKLRSEGAFTCVLE
jgi:predicted AAA+ superfamily ATPase